MDFPNSFGDWIKWRRKSLDLTQDELAQRAGCSIFALRKIESGERRPSKQLAGLLSRSLDIPPDDQDTFVRVARGELKLERLRTPASESAAPISSDRKQGFLPLPISTTPLIAREPELAALERLFTDPQCRLMTLTGLGGIGKTRLAIEFAGSRSALFPGGVWFIPLASLRSPDLIVPAIADGVRLSFSGPNDPKEQLVNYLANLSRHAMLLVLDNIEHLLVSNSTETGQPEAIGLVNELLLRVPNLKLLVTSRERLNVRGEWLYELHGLPIPPLDYSGPLDEYGAAALFVLSARCKQPHFEVSLAERPALIRVCQMLEGIPLALELAAAWVEILSCDEIAREIEANLDFLTTSMRDIPERHRSIRATFDHSWKLLSGEERRVLRQLSIFHGGFTRQAAGHIAGASLPILASLHSKSLIRRAENGRYDLHEVIRQYALSYFSGDPQNEEIRDCHSDFYLGLLSAHEKGIKSARQQDAIRELTGEMDNVRAGWDWAVRREKFTLVGKSLRCFGWLCNIAGWLREGIEQIEQVVRALRARLERSDYVENVQDKKFLGYALAQQGMLYFRKGLFEEAQAAYEESLAILRPIHDPAFLTDPLVYRGIIMHLMGDYSGAQTLMEEGVACARAAGDEWFEIYACYNQGYIASLTGDYARGYQLMRDGLARWRSIGDPSSIALGLNYISPAAIKLGHLDEAQTFLEESLSICKVVGDRWSMGTAYRNLGLTALAKGNSSEAQTLLHKSLATFGGHIEGWDIARSLTYLGDAELLDGRLNQARKSYLDALRIAVDTRSIPLALDALVGLARCQAESNEIDPAVQLACQILKHAAATQFTKDACDQIISEAGRQRSSAQLASLREQIPLQSIESTIEVFLSQG